MIITFVLALLLGFMIGFYAGYRQTAVDTNKAVEAYVQECIDGEEII